MTTTGWLLFAGAVLVAISVPAAALLLWRFDRKS